MGAELIPICLTITAGDRYTLWAPQWRADGDEWEGLLGKDESVYGFCDVADLVAFARSGVEHDLSDHPGWPVLAKANAHKFVPTKKYYYDLIAVEELLTDKPTKRSVHLLAKTLDIVASIGSICELPTITKFFNGNPTLGLFAGGIENFDGRAGRKRWDNLAKLIDQHWDDILMVFDELIVVPEVDSGVAQKAAQELAEPAPVDYDKPDESENVDQPIQLDPDPVAMDRVVLGSDKDFWFKVGIDPIQIMTDTDTFYTLRCYLGDQPVFLGRNGRISVFSSERALARYLADEHEHDLADLATYDDIRTAATDGSLSVTATEDNIYVLADLADDFMDGPDMVDRNQLELAIEFLLDVGSYAEDSIVTQMLDSHHSLGQLVTYIINPQEHEKPQGPYVDAVNEWEQLLQFVDSRLRRE